MTLSGTKNHPVWLPSEEVWVGLGELEAGDTLLSRYGLVTVAQVTSHPAAPVYNISVQQQHVYEVTEWGIVVHNNDWCEELQELRKKKQDAEARGEKLSDKDQKRLGELEDWAKSAHSRPINTHLSVDEIAENFGMNLIEKHGDPARWKHRFTKYEPLTQVGARPGEVKVYEVWEDEFGKRFEWHYEIDEFGRISNGKYKFPSTTSKPK